MYIHEPINSYTIPYNNCDYQRGKFSNYEYRFSIFQIFKIVILILIQLHSLIPLPLLINLCFPFEGLELGVALTTTADELVTMATEEEDVRLVFTGAVTERERDFREEDEERDEEKERDDEDEGRGIRIEEEEEEDSSLLKPL